MISISSCLLETVSSAKTKAVCTCMPSSLSRDEHSISYALPHRVSDVYLIAHSKLVQDSVDAGHLIRVISDGVLLRSDTLHDLP